MLCYSSYLMLVCLVTLDYLVTVTSVYLAAITLVLLGRCCVSLLSYHMATFLSHPNASRPIAISLSHPTLLSHPNASRPIATLLSHPILIYLVTPKLEYLYLPYAGLRWHLSPNATLLSHPNASLFSRPVARLLSHRPNLPCYTKTRVLMFTLCWITLTPIPQCYIT